MQYNEIYTSFAIDRSISPQFDLLISFHPEQNRHLTEEEENLFFSFLKLVQLENIPIYEDLPNYMEVAKQYLKYFPTIRSYNDKDIFFNSEWSKILKSVDVLQIGYIFHPEEFGAKQKVKNSVEIFKKSFHNNIKENSRTKGKIIWTFPLPLSGYFAKEVEENFGLTKDLKNKISLNKYPSGFIANYLSHINSDFNLLGSRQFEELVGLLYENEGWHIEITKETRDGGKDAIATKVEDGEKIVAYIQAKNPIKNKISEPEVREFFAVIRDETDLGYFVTSSEFTKDARKWIEQKMLISPVKLELIDNNDVRKKLMTLVGKEGYKYLKKV